MIGDGGSEYADDLEIVAFRGWLDDSDSTASVSGLGPGDCPPIEGLRGTLAEIPLTPRRSSWRGDAVKMGDSDRASLGDAGGPPSCPARSSDVVKTGSIMIAELVSMSRTWSGSGSPKSSGEPAAPERARIEIISHCTSIICFIFIASSLSS